MKTKKRIFAVSDVHGYYDELIAALDKAGFDKDNENHLLVCCGDYFDRGPKNTEVLKYFERLKNAVLLKGNHEDMLLDILYKCKLESHHFSNKTDRTIVEFFGRMSIDQYNRIDFSGNNRTADRLIEFIGGLGDYFETENYVFTHGWLPNRKDIGDYTIDKNWRSAPEERWKRARWDDWVVMFVNGDRLEGKTIVCGHRSTSYASRFDATRSPECYAPFKADGIIAIDGTTAASGRVNVLVVEDYLI